MLLATVAFVAFAVPAAAQTSIAGTEAVNVTIICNDEAAAREVGAAFSYFNEQELVEYVNARHLYRHCVLIPQGMSLREGTTTFVQSWDRVDRRTVTLGRRNNIRTRSGVRTIYEILVADSL